MEIREAGKTPESTTPLAMLSANLPAPMKPSLKVLAGIGANTAISSVAEIGMERQRLGEE